MTGDANRGRAPTGSVTIVAATAALGGFLFGYDTAVINGTVDAIQSDFDVSDLFLGFIVSSALFASAFGAFFAGPLADRFGRIRVMVIAAILFGIGGLGSSLAWDPGSLIFFRLVGGLAVGAASVIAPAYIAEVAPPQIRGRLGSLQQLAIVFGIFAALVVDYGLAQAAGGANERLALGGDAWRWMFASAAVPAFVYGALSLRIPESPRFLVKAGRDDQALKVLQRFNGGDVRPLLRDIHRTLENVPDRIKLRELRGPRFGLLPVVWVGILLSVLQQFVGINVIFYYSTSLWQSVGFSEANAFITSVITSLVNIVGTFGAIGLIDKVGRKPLLLAGATAMFITQGLLTYCFSHGSGSGKDITLPQPWGTIALVSANLFVFSFAISWGPVVWVLLGEMFNNRIRATALAVAAAAQWLANWAISTSFPQLSGVSLVLAYGIYTGAALLAVLLTLFGVRETKGRTLESM
jgi:SP family sugar:H+ symporter-like MFS transporter